MNLCFTETIKDFPRYIIARDGRVIALQKRAWNGKVWHNIPSKQLKITIDSEGYPSVTLRKDGEGFRKRLHVLLAEAFIPNPENKPTVNHKKGIKTDYRLEELEWNTYSENNKHAYDAGLKKAKLGTRGPQRNPSGLCGDKHPNAREVLQIKDGIVIRKWKFAKEAREEGFIPSLISHCCLGKRKNHKGFNWQFA